MALHLRPHCVRRDTIRDPGCSPVNWDDPDLNFADYSPTGVVGTPVYASRELGERLWREVVSAVVGTFKRIAEEQVLASKQDACEGL